jgi:hypothetical protein
MTTSQYVKNIPRTCQSDEQSSQSPGPRPALLCPHVQHCCLHPPLLQLAPGQPSPLPVLVYFWTGALHMSIDC